MRFLALSETMYWTYTELPALRSVSVTVAGYVKKTISFR